MRRTKIVATLGPATHNPEILSGLISVGADVLRLNFSHGTRDDHARLVEMARTAAKKAGREVGLLGDIPGPKIRLGDLEGDVMHLRNGQDLTLTTDGTANGRDTIPVAWAGLPAAVKPDDVIYLADGSIRLRVRECGGSRGPEPGRDRRHRGLTPGHEPAGRRGASRLRWTSPTSTGWTSRSTTASTCWRCRSCDRERPGPGPRAAGGARRGHPGDREDREARGGRGRRGDRAGARTESWSRAGTSASRCRSRACRRSRSGCCRSPGATPGRPSPPRRCWPRWSARRARRAPRRPTWRTPSTTGPTR